MVFPIGAHVWELAADHLDRLPRKSLIDGLVHKRGVANDDNAASAEQPENRAESWGNETQDGDGNNQGSVALRARGAKGSDNEILSIELAEKPETREQEDDVEEQKRAGNQGVDAQDEEAGSVVAREVAQVVVDTRLHLGEVGRLREALEVAELADGPQVGEAAREGGVAEASEAVLNVQARRQDVEGDLEASHDDVDDAENRTALAKVSQSYEVVVVQTRIVRV